MLRGRDRRGIDDVAADLLDLLRVGQGPNRRHEPRGLVSVLPRDPPEEEWLIRDSGVVIPTGLLVG